MNQHARSPRRWVLFTIKIAVSLLLLVLLVRSVPVKEVLRCLSGVSGFARGANVVLVGIGVGLSGYRWHLASAGTIPLSVCLKFSWIGNSYRYVLPGSVAGDVARTAALVSSAGKFRAAMVPVSVLMDRVGSTATSVFLFLAVCGGHWWMTVRSFWVAVTVCLVLACGLVALTLLPGLMLWVAAKLWEADRMPGPIRKLSRQTSAPLSQITQSVWRGVLWSSMVMHVIPSVTRICEFQNPTGRRMKTGE